MKSVENFYMQQPESIRGCLLALRKIILSQNADISDSLQYGMPFFSYRGKRFCYLWVHKKYNQPYLGVVDGKYFDQPELISEKRSRMKIMLFDPAKDLPLKTIRTIVQKAIVLCART